MTSDKWYYREWPYWILSIVLAALYGWVIWNWEIIREVVQI